MSEDIAKEFVSGLFGVLVVATPIILSALLAHWGSKKKKKKEEPSTHVKLKHHPVFARLKAYQSYVKTGFYMENKGKQEVFRCLLLTEIQNRYDLLYALAEDVEGCMSGCTAKNANDCNWLYNKNIEALGQGLEMLNTFYINGGFTEQEQSVLKIVLTKFNKWHEPRIKRMEETLPLVCNSKFYPDCYTRQAVIFDMYLGTISDMINDAERTLNEINGDLTGMVFRGITIEGHKK